MIQQQRKKKRKEVRLIDRDFIDRHNIRETTRRAEIKKERKRSRKGEEGRTIERVHDRKRWRERMSDKDKV
jgi:hypothetical protein